MGWPAIAKPVGAAVSAWLATVRIAIGDGGSDNVMPLTASAGPSPGKRCTADRGYFATSCDDIVVDVGDDRVCGRRS